MGFDLDNFRELNTETQRHSEGNVKKRRDYFLAKPRRKAHGFR